MPPIPSPPVPSTTPEIYPETQSAIAARVLVQKEVDAIGQRVEDDVRNTNPAAGDEMEGVTEA